MHDATRLRSAQHTLPAGHERHDVNGVELVAHSDVAGALVAVLRETGSLYDWAAECPQPRALRGRAPVYVATVPGTAHVVAIRHAWHGGLLAPITGDRWLRPARAARELHRSIALQMAGIATAPVLGYALYPAGPRMVRVDVVSHFLDDSHDLGAVLSGLVPSVGLDEALDATRILLMQLAANRLVHPDLNVKNILLRRSRVAIEAVIIDVDVMQHAATSTPASVMLANAGRLLRSMTKRQRYDDAAIDVGRLAAFHRALVDSTPIEPSGAHLESWG